MAKGIKTGGRQKGTPNKNTAEVKSLPQQYGPEAIDTLVKIMRDSENDTARIAASKEIMDRAYGKAAQAVEVSGPEGEPFSIQIIRFGAKDDNDPAAE